MTFSTHGVIWCSSFIKSNVKMLTSPWAQPKPPGNPHTIKLLLTFKKNHHLGKIWDQSRQCHRQINTFKLIIESRNRETFKNHYTPNFLHATMKVCEFEEVLQLKITL